MTSRTRFFWTRQLPPGSADLEKLLLFATTVFAAGCFLYLSFGLPWPKCFLRSGLGIPCPTCGATRCALALADGNVGSAWALNPLMFCLYSGLVLFDLYAGAVLLFGLPRLRLNPLPAQAKKRLGIFCFVALAANWAYLLSNAP
jgi:hypothetical protein